MTVTAGTAGTAIARLKIARRRRRRRQGGEEGCREGQVGPRAAVRPELTHPRLPPRHANAASGPAGSSPPEPWRGAGAWGDCAGLMPPAGTAGPR